MRASHFIKELRAHRIGYERRGREGREGREREREREKMSCQVAVKVVEDIEIGFRARACIERRRS